MALETLVVSFAVSELCVARGQWSPGGTELGRL
jgi:hypothetical protein